MDRKPEVFVIDVDGVMTTGGFHYDSRGKVHKVFGPDDNDALKILSHFMQIQFVSGDHRGFPISQARIERDMKMPLELVSTYDRVEWIEQRWSLDKVIYMGDGIFDNLVFNKVAYGIAPENADAHLKSIADFVTERKGGDRAVSEASLHILANFFGIEDRVAMVDLVRKKEAIRC